MTASSSAPGVAQHFEGREPQVLHAYAAILAAARRLGPCKEDPKKSTIHLVRETAFAGVSTRKAALILTLKSSCDIDDPRIVKREQTSARRWHLDMRLDSPAQVDARLIELLAHAYALS